MAWRDVRPGTHLTLSATAADTADLPFLLSFVRPVASPSGPAPTA